jgi:hypothetical protein
MADVVPRADEIAARHAYEVQGRIKETQRRIKEAWIDLARDLYEFSSDRLWKDLGYSSFEEWAADPDIDIGRRWAYELITLYKSLVIQHEIAPERLVAIPVECDRCGGGGIRWISESDRVAAYPGGPFLGREPGEFARALARVGVALDVV